MSIQTEQANGVPSQQLFCTCWDLLGCSLGFTLPFTSSRTPRTPGASVSLGHLGTLTALQSTPLVLLPLTEMPQESLLTSGLLKFSVLSLNKMCVYVWGRALCRFVHPFFFLPTNPPGPGIRSCSNIPITSNIDHIKNACLLNVRLPSHIQLFITTPLAWSMTCSRGI